MTQANRLLQLILLNRTTPRRFQIEAKADDEATIYLYDFVGSDGWGGGVDAQAFVKDVTGLKAKTIHLRVNSPGGNVFDGNAMAVALRQHSAKVIAHIDGLAASAASWIALAADEVRIARGAMLMIHRASSFAWGNAEDLRERAALLDKMDLSLVSDYAKQTGNDEEQVRAWLNAETWFTADEAVEHGFADAIDEDAPKAEATWDLSAFANAPQLERTPDPAPTNTDPQDDTADIAHQERLRRTRLVLNCLR